MISEDISVCPFKEFDNMEYYISPVVMASGDTDWSVRYYLIPLNSPARPAKPVRRRTSPVYSRLCYAQNAIHTSDSRPFTPTPVAPLYTVVMLHGKKVFLDAGFVLIQPDIGTALVYDF